MSQLVHLYRQGEDYFFRGISTKYLDLDDSANAYMTGDAGLNFIYITKNTNVLDKILIEGKEFFAQDNLSFLVFIPEKLCTPKLREIFSNHGYTQDSKSVSMALELDPYSLEQTDKISEDIMIKANNERLQEWMMPLIGAFESTFDICTRYAATHDTALKQNINLHHFSLYQQDKPIASITLSLHDGIARIDDVGTLPEFQGRGYASALMRYILSKAKKLGAQYCFLEASDSGLRVYQKLGFKPLFNNHIYSRNA